jgi:hypothetical protein
MMIAPFHHRLVLVLVSVLAFAAVAVALGGRPL